MVPRNYNSKYGGVACILRLNVHNSERPRGKRVKEANPSRSSAIMYFK